MKTILSKESAKALAWLSRSLGRDDGRPALKAFHVQHRSVLTCDGWRLHAMPVESVYVQALEEIAHTVTDNQGVQMIGKPQAGATVEIESDHEARLPDVGQIVRFGEAKIVADFHINPKYLADALAGIEDCARVVVREGREGLEVFGKNKDGASVYALVMPMYHVPDRDQLEWSPLVEARKERDEAARERAEALAASNTPKEEKTDVPETPVREA